MARLCARMRALLRWFNAGIERVLIFETTGPRFVACVGDWQRAAHDAFTESGEESPWFAL